MRVDIFYLQFNYFRYITFPVGLRIFYGNKYKCRLLLLNINDNNKRFLAVRLKYHPCPCLTLTSYAH